mmetsp:Transcript_31772/g.92833  ORF Transcript_31772/g.92833 Transcript_31772/m.92833 type:complete len:461 (-) Transcript_31772:4-1386(-)
MGSSSATAIRILYRLALTFLLCAGRIESFTFQAEASHRRSCSVAPLLGQDNAFSREGISRREAGRVAVGGVIATVGVLTSTPVYADEGYRQAKRPFAYRVDSTQPPTLIPINNAQNEMKILQELGKGLGTKKEAIVNDSINLNNILNKAVFGTIDAISSLTQGGDGKIISGPGFASFVCLGLPMDASPADVGLAKDLIDPMLRSRSMGGETSLGLSFCPLSTQASLDSYISTGDLATLVSFLKDKGVSETTIDLYRPLLEYSHAKSLKLLALLPEQEDIRIARTKGLQYVDPDRRTSYVVDPNGFIALSQQPRFRVYADRSLLKDYEPMNNDDSAGLFFAERILVHETAAGVVAQYAVQRPDSLVILVAPTRDLRFLQGINGRIPRLCAFLNPEVNKVTDNAVTTILLNPSAKETLSKTNYLRLEIGTGPETLDYQSKVADYLWFSFMPKVNMIPRLMNG